MTTCLEYNRTMDEVCQHVLSTVGRWMRYGQHVLNTVGRWMRYVKMSDTLARWMDEVWLMCLGHGRTMDEVCPL